MKLKQTMRKIVLGVIFSMAAFVVTSPSTFATDSSCGVQTAIIHCSNVDTKSTDVQKSAIWSLLLVAINILTAGVGVLALAGLIWGAILYTSAGGSAEQIKKAREIFTNVVIGVIAFAGMYALLNFIIPGGIFKP